MLITQPQNLKAITHLVPQDVPFGSIDTIPGLLSSRLPAKPNDFNQDDAMSKRRTIFAHNVRLSEMQGVEETF